MLKAYLSSLVFLFLTAFINYLLIPYLGYRATGFGFLVGVLPVAVGCGLGPALLFATLSALLWDYFFIPPQFTFSIQNSEDVMMNLTYFVVALVTGILGSRIQSHEKTLKAREDKANRNALLEESEKLHQTLLNSVSHELRTPLTTILGIVNHLDFVSKSPETSLVVHDLKVSAERLNQTVTNLLDMSRISSGALRLNQSVIDLSDFIRTCVARADYMLENHHVTILDPKNAIYVKGDEKILETAFANLLSNAARYSPEGSEIRIDLSASTSASNEFAAVKITNSGANIPAGDEEIIFGKFYSTSGGVGLGLGLVIVREIVALHRGTVSAKTTDGFTTFNVLLPIEELPDQMKVNLQVV